jgi:hypothetical protein
MERPRRPESPAARPEGEPGGELEAWRSGRHVPATPSPPAEGPELDEPSSDTRRHPLLRFRPRSWKGAIGLGIGAAAVLLFVIALFDGEARLWVPLAAGLAVLVLLALLRLDRLLNGWTWHVAGVALLVGLVYETSGNPWSWAFAASVGVFIAGLLRLPRWYLAAIGAGLCVLSFVGYQFRAHEVQEQKEQVAQQAGTEMRLGFGYGRPDLVLSKLNDGLVRGDHQAVCNVLDPAAKAQVAQSGGAADCDAAITAAATRVPAGSPTAAPTPTPKVDPGAPAGTIVQLDGCPTVWGRTLPAVGKVEAVRTAAAQATWRVAGFQPCQPTA